MLIPLYSTTTTYLLLFVSSLFLYQSSKRVLPLKNPHPLPQKKIALTSPLYPLFVHFCPFQISIAKRKNCNFRLNFFKHQNSNITKKHERN